VILGGGGLGRQSCCPRRELGSSIVVPSLVVRCSFAVRKPRRARPARRRPCGRLGLAGHL